MARGSGETFGEDAPASTRGKKMLKVDPLPTSLETVMAPLPFLTIPCTTERPMPDPSLGFFVVKKGSKALSCTSFVIPTPVSDTDSRR